MERSSVNALPSRAAGRIQDVGTLEHLLAHGWQIDGPVLKRPLWSAQQSDIWAYHFILACAARRSLVVVDESPSLRAFIAEHAIAVM